MFKKIIMTTALVGFATMANSAKLNLTVESSSEEAKKIMVAVYPKKHSENFPYGKGRIMFNGKDGLEAVAKDGIVTFEVDLPPGKYALAGFHDLNSDGELNTLIFPFGLPSEPYGFSNDASGLFGPASFESSEIEITEDGLEHSFQVN